MVSGSRVMLSGGASLTPNPHRGLRYWTSPEDEPPDSLIGRPLSKILDGPLQVIVRATGQCVWRAPGQVRAVPTRGRNAADVRRRRPAATIRRQTERSSLRSRCTAGEALSLPTKTHTHMQVFLYVG